MYIVVSYLKNGKNDDLETIYDSQLIIEQCVNLQEVWDYVKKVNGKYQCCENWTHTIIKDMYIYKYKDFRKLNYE
jgi:hypothetical protein